MGETQKNKRLRLTSFSRFVYFELQQQNEREREETPERRELREQEMVRHV